MHLGKNRERGVFMVFLPVGFHQSLQLSHPLSQLTDLLESLLNTSYITRTDIKKESVSNGQHGHPSEGP